MKKKKRPNVDGHDYMKNFLPYFNAEILITILRFNLILGIILILICTAHWFGVIYRNTDKNIVI